MGLVQARMHKHMRAHTDRAAAKSVVHMIHGAIMYHKRMCGMPPSEGADLRRRACSHNNFG